MFISSSNQKCQSFPMLLYFSVVVCLMWWYHYILSAASYKSKECWAAVAITTVQHMKIIRYVVDWNSYLVRALHFLIIIITQPYLKAFQPFSQLYARQYMGLHVSGLLYSVLIIVTTFCYHHQKGVMNHQSLYRIVLWNMLVLLGFCTILCSCYNA